MTCFIGIDGGGSNLRIVIRENNQTTVKEYTSANPNVLGHDTAQNHIRNALIDANQSTSSTSIKADAIAIGIAGASADHSRQWLIETIKPCLPSNTLIVPSSDIEIALIGAHEQSFGVLLLAGTGSIAYAIDTHNQHHRVGGWGYLMGDEGSGYWLGVQALNHLTQQIDRRLPQTDLYHTLTHHLKLVSPYDLVQWVYRQQSQPPTKTIAELAPILLDLASKKDPSAVVIVDSAINHLTQLAQTACLKAGLPHTTIAFAGGLLQHPMMKQRLTESLSLTHDPTPKNEPAIGAILLAQMTYEGRIPLKYPSE